MLVVMNDRTHKVYYRTYYEAVTDDLYEQNVDQDRPRASQFVYCEDITEKYLDKMSMDELKFWYETYIDKGKKP